MMTILTVEKALSMIVPFIVLNIAQMKGEMMMKIRKYEYMSRDDRMKVWENNPKFREMIHKAFVKEQEQLIATDFNQIEGALVDWNIECDGFILKIEDGKKFFDSLLEIESFQECTEIYDVAKFVQKNNYYFRIEHLNDIIGELEEIVHGGHRMINSEGETLEFLAFCEQSDDNFNIDSFYYDDNYVLYQIEKDDDGLNIKSFA